ncbi:hypothetical protein FQA39_LY17796 [Lamprigera yunnana]|nr:hypothetical protein FQA39_LY17796 [Lamprigera yunnana]
MILRINTEEEDEEVLNENSLNEEANNKTDHVNPEDSISNSENIIPIEDNIHFIENAEVIFVDSLDAEVSGPNDNRALDNSIKPCNIETIENDNEMVSAPVCENCCDSTCEYCSHEDEIRNERESSYRGIKRQALQMLNNTNSSLFSGTSVI